MAEWVKAEAEPTQRSAAPRLDRFEVTATRGSSGYMLKLSRTLYWFAKECGANSGEWFVAAGDDADRLALHLSADANGPGHKLCSDFRVSMGLDMSLRYGAAMFGHRCRARFEADADCARIVIWPHDHATDAQDDGQQELPL